MKKYALWLISQLPCLSFVEREITINGVDGYAIKFSRVLLGHVTVPNVIEHLCWVAFQRVAQAAAAGGFQADDISRMQRVVRVS